MSSIYNEDITMTHKNNIGKLNPFGDGETDIASLQAALDSMSDDVKSLSDQVDDWQKLSLEVCEERDRLRVIVANRDAEISLLNNKIARLERCVVQNALHNSDVASRQEENNDDNIIFHAGRQVRNEIDRERHNDGEGN